MAAGVAARRRRGGSCRSSPGLLPFLLCFASLFGLNGCGGGGGGGAGGGGGGSAGGGGAEQPPMLVSDPAPTASATPQTPAGLPPPGPVVTSYEPNYVPNLTATRTWDHPVVTVGIALPAESSAGAAPAADPSPLVQEAIDLWNHKVGKEIQFQLVSGGVSTNPDITIDWVATNALPGESIGRTQVQFRNDDQVLISAQIAVVESLPDSFKVQVVAHELGHAMGIDGHSDDATDLMYPNSHLPAVVTESDQNTVLWSYEVGPTRSATRRSSGGIGTASSIGTMETLCGGVRQ